MYACILLGNEFHPALPQELLLQVILNLDCPVILLRMQKNKLSTNKI